MAVADGDPVAFVFKTVSDQYGKYPTLGSGRSLCRRFCCINSRTGDNEKLGRLYMMRGKKATEVKSLVTGDIGAIAKMDKVRTNDTLSAKGIVLNPIPSQSRCSPRPSPQDQGPGR